MFYYILDKLSSYFNYLTNKIKIYCFKQKEFDYDNLVIKLSNGNYKYSIEFDEFIRVAYKYGITDVNTLALMLNVHVSSLVNKLYNIGFKVRKGHVCLN